VHYLTKGVLTKTAVQYAKSLILRFDFARSFMLPRHLRSLVLSGPNRLFHPPFRIPHTTAGFHSSSSRRNEPPKSPFQTFVEVLKDELRKNRELQDNMKQLQGDVDKFQDSEAIKKARAAYERARVCTFIACIAHWLKTVVKLTSIIKESPRLRAAADELRRGGVKVGDAVSEALKTMEESEVMRAVRLYCRLS
jgi:mitochondrial import inner membrane translocase subunit TIM44